jgi:hypothetical protein
MRARHTESDSLLCGQTPGETGRNINVSNLKISILGLVREITFANLTINSEPTELVVWFTEGKDNGRRNDPSDRST